jgi:hypothetical protein
MYLFVKQNVSLCEAECMSLRTRMYDKKNQDLLQLVIESMAQTRVLFQGIPLQRNPNYYKLTCTAGRACPAPAPVTSPGLLGSKPDLIGYLYSTHRDPAYSSQQRIRSRAGTGHDPLHALAPAPARRAPRASRPVTRRRQRIVVRAGERADETVLECEARAVGVRVGELAPGASGSRHASAGARRAGGEKTPTSSVLFNGRAPEAAGQRGPRRRWRWVRGGVEDGHAVERAARELVVAQLLVGVPFSIVPPDTGEARTGHPSAAESATRRGPRWTATHPRRACTSGARSLSAAWGRRT